MIKTRLGKESFVIIFSWKTKSGLSKLCWSCFLFIKLILRILYEYAKFEWSAAARKNHLKSAVALAILGIKTKYFQSFKGIDDYKDFGDVIKDGFKAVFHGLLNWNFHWFLAFFINRIKITKEQNFAVD